MGHELRRRSRTQTHCDGRHAHRRAPTKDSIGAALEHTRRAAGDCDVRIAAPGVADLHDAVAR